MLTVSNWVRLNRMCLDSGFFNNSSRYPLNPPMVSCLTLAIEPVRSRRNATRVVSVAPLEAAFFFMPLTLSRRSTVRQAGTDLFSHHFGGKAFGPQLQEGIWKLK